MTRFKLKLRSSGASISNRQIFLLAPSYQILLLRLAAVWGGPRLIGLCGATGAIPDCPRFIRAEMDNLKSYGESHREAGEITGLDKITLVVLAHDPRVGLAGPRDDATTRTMAPVTTSG